MLDAAALRAALGERRALRRRAPLASTIDAPAPGEIVTDAGDDAAGGLLLDELIVTERHLEALAQEHAATAAQAEASLRAVYERRPALRAERAELAGAHARLVARIAAAGAAQRALDAATVLGRGPAARLLNAAGMPRWTSWSAGARGVRFADDLALHKPVGAALDADADPVLARLAVRAGIAATAGVYSSAALAPAMASPVRSAVAAGGAVTIAGPSATTPPAAGVPLVLIEPFEGFDAAARARLVEYLASQVSPHPQVLVISRLRSRWEHVRWEAPKVFPRLQLVSL